MAVYRAGTHTHRQETALPSHYPENTATEVQFAFTFSQIACHFRHDESVVIYAANGLSYDHLINKH